MRPTPIPDEEVWKGARRVVIGPPEGIDMYTIRPVEVLIDSEDIGPRFCMRLMPDDGDLDRLAAGEPLWLIMNTNQLVPFALAFAEPT